MTISSRFAKTLIVSAIATLWAVGMAVAQPVFNNPPCPNVTVTNNTANTVVLQVITTPALYWPIATIPPFTSFNYPVPGGGITVLGVVSCSGMIIPFNLPGGPVPCGPNDWWIKSIALPQTCECYDICLDPHSCTITIFGPTPPPCANP